MSDNSKSKGSGSSWRGRGGGGGGWGRGGGGWKNNSNNNTHSSKRSSWKEDIECVIKKIADIVEEHGTIYTGTLEDYELTKDRKVPKCRRPFNVRIYVDEKEGRRKEFSDIFKPLVAAGIVVFKTLKVDDFLIELNFKLLYSDEFKTLEDLAKSTMSGHMHKQVVNKHLVNDFRYLGEFGKTRMWVIIQKQCQSEVNISGSSGRGFASSAARSSSNSATVENTMLSSAAASGPSIEALMGKGCVFNKYKKSSVTTTTITAGAATNNATAPMAMNVLSQEAPTESQTPLTDFISCTSVSGGFALNQTNEAFHCTNKTFNKGEVVPTDALMDDTSTRDNGSNETEEAPVEDYSWSTDNAKWFDGHPLGRKQLIGSKRHRVMLDGMTVLQTETFEHTAFELLAILLDAYKYTDRLWERFQMDEQPYFDIDKFNVSVTDENMTLSEQLQFIESRESRGATKQDIERYKMSAEMALFVSQIKQHHGMSIERAHALAVEFSTPYKMSLYLNEYRGNPQPVITRLSKITSETGGDRFGPKLAMKIFNNHFGTQHDTTTTGKVIFAGSTPLPKGVRKKQKVEAKKTSLASSASSSSSSAASAADAADSDNNNEENDDFHVNDKHSLTNSQEEEVVIVNKKSKHKRRRITEDEEDENDAKAEEHDEAEYVFTPSLQPASSKNAAETRMVDAQEEEEDECDVVDLTCTSEAKAAFMPTYLKLKKEINKHAAPLNDDGLASYLVNNTTTERTLKECSNDQPVKKEASTSDVKPPKYASKYKQKEKQNVV